MLEERNVMLSVEEKKELRTYIVEVMVEVLPDLITRVVDGLVVKRVTPQFEALDDKFDALSNMFEALSDKFDGLNDKFDGLNARIDKLETKMDAIETRVEAFEERYQFDHNEIMTALRNIQASMVDAVGRSEFQDLKYRVGLLEKQAKSA